MTKEEALILQDMKNHVDAVFTVMNWFASGESQGQWSRAEPLAILGEVYFNLAPVSQMLQGLVVESKGSAKRYLKERESEIRDRLTLEFDKRVANIQASCDQKVSNAEHRAATVTEAALKEAQKEVDYQMSIINQRVADGIAADIARREGSRVAAGSRSVKL